MKLLREKLAERITERLAAKGYTLARIDRWNRQPDYMEEEAPVDWNRGAVFIEIEPVAWEQCSDRRLQEGDVTIRLHVCRTFYSSSANDSEAPDPLATFDLVHAVTIALHGESLTDDQGRSLSTPWVRTSHSEDADHDGLEIDQIGFTARVFNYLTDTIGNYVEATADPIPTPEPPFNT